MSSEWCVRFNREGEPGKGISLNKQLTWGGRTVYIPAVYLCKEGIVLDIFMEVDREVEKAFLEKWVPIVARGNLSRRQHRQIRNENPLNWGFHCDVYANGEWLRDGHSSGSGWIPEDLRPEEEDFSDRLEDTLQHYGLDIEKVWGFRRCDRNWSADMPELASLEVILRMEAQEFTGEPFAMPEERETVQIVSPITGQRHSLTVEEIQSFQTPVPEQFAEYEMPDWSVSMVYRLEPDLPREEIAVKDTQESDQARRKDGTPYSGGCFGVMHRIPESGLHLAMSSMRFEAPESILWEPVFLAKTVDDLVVTLL